MELQLILLFSQEKMWKTSEDLQITVYQQHIDSSKKFVGLKLHHNLHEQNRKNSLLLKMSAGSLNHKPQRSLSYQESPVDRQ